MELDGVICATSAAPAQLIHEKTGAQVQPRDFVRCELALGDVLWWRRAREGQEAILHVSITMSESSSCWAPAGHEIAFAQGYLPPISAVHGTPAARPSPTTASLTSNTGISVRESGSVIIVEGPRGLCVKLDKERGGLVGLRFEGVEMIAEGAEGQGILLQNFWRAHTDNDNGGADILIRHGGTQQRSVYMNVVRVSVCMNVVRVCLCVSVCVMHGQKINSV